MSFDNSNYKNYKPSPLRRCNSCPAKLNMHTYNIDNINDINNTNNTISWYDKFDIFYAKYRPSEYPPGYSPYGDPYWAWRDYCLKFK